MASNYLYLTYNLLLSLMLILGIIIYNIMLLGDHDLLRAEQASTNQTQLTVDVDSLPTI